VAVICHSDFRQTLTISFIDPLHKSGKKLEVCPSGKLPCISAESDPFATLQHRIAWKFLQRFDSYGPQSSKTGLGGFIKHVGDTSCNVT
jgi:hypothetical protein